ncbi:hypothetical protein HK098_006311 [Nowakowskiella sp. JEL0407]|nr:hypothetical protein HK098_006311 [Nowakowskiella sp. JEL0407]
MNSYSICVIAAGSFSAFYITKWVLWWANAAITTPNSRKTLEEKKKLGIIAKFEDIPGPVGYPIIGQFFKLIGYVKRKRLDLLVDNFNTEYNGLCRVYAGDRHAVFVDDAAIAKKLLNSPDQFSRGNAFQTSVFDFAPLALFALPGGEQWKKHRKGLQPAFGPVHLREAFAVSLEVADKLLDFWEAEIREKEFAERDFMEDFVMLTGDIISKVAFSADLGAVDSLGKEKSTKGFHEHMKVLALTIQKRTGFRALSHLWYFFGATTSQINPSIQYLSKLVNNVITEKQQYINSKKLQNQDDKQDADGEKWSRDLLDRLLATEGSVKFTEEEILSEMFGFFLAGHETTATSLTWVAYMLIKFPEVYEKLKLEIDSAFGQNKPTLETLGSLRYLDAVCKETGRLFPVVNAILRDSATDAVITSTDGLQIAVPSGVQFLVNIPRIHTSAKYWGANAKEFAPERWLSDGFVPVPGSYLPFGDGMMSCIGQKMAFIEIKVTLVRILQRFTISMSPKQGPVVPITTLTFGLKNGLMIDVRRRLE